MKENKTIKDLIRFLYPKVQFTYGDEEEVGIEMPSLKLTAVLNDTGDKETSSIVWAYDWMSLLEKVIFFNEK